MLNTQQLNDALAANYLLASVELRSWSGTKTDKVASEEVTVSKGAVRDAARVVKKLLASADAELEEVRRAGTAIRNYVYEHTLPWSRSTEGAKRGERLLPSSRTIEFLREVNHLKQEYDTAVSRLVQVWPQRIAQAQLNLGGMADATEYPDASELASYFGCTVDLIPIPAVSDFSRLNVPAALTEALGETYLATAKQQVDNAMEELRTRFQDELERFERQMAKQGAGEKTKLYETLITNMSGLVRMAREMNVAGNPKLAELADRIEARLLQYPLEVYKNDTAKAQVAAADARELQAAAAVADVWEQL